MFHLDLIDLLSLINFSNGILVAEMTSFPCGSGITAKKRSFRTPARSAVNPHGQS